MRQGPRQYTIASYVAPSALRPGTRGALRRLGYELLPAVLRGNWDDGAWASDIRLVDERHLARLPGDATPLLVLSGDPGRHWANERVVGAVGRPADVASLYPILQRVLETHARAAARAPARIEARGNIGDRRFGAQILTLSRRGCLIESSESLESGACLNLRFPLPGFGGLALRGRLCRVTGTRAAIEFENVPASAGHQLADYVQRRLATA